MSYILFTAWGYEISILEFVASVTSLIGVWLGTTGKRITWPFWACSSALYAIFFYQANLIASAALQFVFIAAALSGWKVAALGTSSYLTNSRSSNASSFRRTATPNSCDYCACKSGMFVFGAGAHSLGLEGSPIRTKLLDVERRQRDCRGHWRQ